MTLTPGTRFQVALDEDWLTVGVPWSPDLHRFLLLETEPLPNPAPLRVLTSWQERLKAR